MIENKETISFDEFRAWMTGLIVGKRGALPDIEDWKMIKKMMDKVVPEREVITIPVPTEQPYLPQRDPWYYPDRVWTSPNTGDPIPNYGTITCNNVDMVKSVHAGTVSSTVSTTYANTPQFNAEELDAALENMFASYK